MYGVPTKKLPHWMDPYPILSLAARLPSLSKNFMSHLHTRIAVRVSLFQGTRLTSISKPNTHPKAKGATESKNKSRLLNGT